MKTMMKRPFCIGLILSIFLLTVPMQTVLAADAPAVSAPIVAIAADAGTVELDGATYRVIRTAEELRAATDAGNYILAGDIDGGDTTVAEPILKLAGGTVLDGNGCRISGFAVETSGAAGSLFAFADSTEKIVIRNLTVGSVEKPVSLKSDKSVSLFGDDTANTVAEWSNNRFYAAAGVTADANLGMVFAHLRGNHTFANCTVNAQIAHNGAWSVGMWFGQQYPTSVLTVTDCVTEGELTTKGQAGGLVGNMQGSATVNGFENRAALTSKSNNAAGVVAYATLEAGVERTFTNCVNVGTLQAKKVVAGIYGFQAGGSNAGTVRFVGCVNRGNLTGTPDIYSGIGGIYGMENKACANLALSFENCSNFGAITGNEICVGGIYGRTTTGATTKNSVNYGALTGVSSGKYSRIGGIAGNSYSKLTTFENCQNFGAIQTGNNLGGIIGQAELGCTITGCTNYGSVSDTVNNAGGIVANAAKVVTITDTANYGAVSTGTAAGFIGTGGATVTMQNCLNAGDISGTSHTGGFVGWTNGVYTLTDCVTIGALSNTGNNIGGVGGVISNDNTVLKNVYCFGSVFSTAMEKAGAVLGVGSKAPATVENVKYLALAGAGSSLGAAEDGAIAAKDAVSLLEGKYTGKRFLLNEAGIPTFAEPVLRGVQNTVVTDGTYRVRFLATLQTLQYDALGFDVAYTYTDANGEQHKTQKKYCEYVMTSVTAAEEDGTVRAVSAAELFGKYLFALTVNDVPEAVGEIVFTVTPFAESAGETYVGQTVRVTYRAGVFAGYGEVEG